VFRGRPLSERTTFDYDSDGRLVGSVTVREATWLSADRWLALALEEFEAGLCPGCGQPKRRAWHPKMRGWYEVDEFDCAGCAAQADNKAESPATFLSLVDMRPKNKPLGEWPAVRGGFD
jgi:hypothetical protein